MIQIVMKPDYAIKPKDGENCYGVMFNGEDIGFRVFGRKASHAEEKLMVVVGNMLITEATKVLSKLHDDALSYDDMLGLAAQMLNIRFKVPDLSDLSQAHKVDDLQNQIKDGCESLIKSVRKIKRRLSAQGQKAGEAASRDINGDGQSETE